MEKSKISPAVYALGQLAQDDFTLALEPGLRDRRPRHKILVGIRSSLAAPDAAALFPKRRRRR